MGTEAVTAGTELLTGPRVVDGKIVFNYPDPDRALSAVRLYQEIQRPRNGPDFTYDPTGGTWILELPVPDAARVEYLVEITDAEGNSAMGTDPFNQTTSPGAFGDKSVVELPGYRSPRWTEGEPAPDGEEQDFEIPCRAVRGSLPAIIWSPPGTEPSEPLPLLIVHDGPEYARLAGLTTFFERALERGRLPRFRAALIGPRDRDQIYSASAGYARSLTHEILPFISEQVAVAPGRNMRIGMGASLGALAMLHAHRRSPAAFGALFLQSGSYFRQRFDKQESGFSRFRRISRFAGQVLATQEWAHPVPITITCGTIEENLANNRAITAALKRQGYDVKLVVSRDGHNWIGWRDTFDPHLADLLTRMWG